ncbi:MAG TPA: hypothetical protein PKN36_08495 [bacterium]|nr:hypothetical protein [bacterium]
MGQKKVFLALLLMTFLACRLGEARIKLVALPDRDKAVVRLDNPAATLVEEERVLLLQKGINKVDFAWKGVQIDSDSIRIQILSHPKEVTLLSVSYPPNEDALVWEINSPQPWEEKIRISYILYNIDRLVTYKFMADKKETKVDMQSFLILRNFSGEDFENAGFHLDYGEPFAGSVQHEGTKQLLFLKKNSIPIEKVFTFDAARLPWDPSKVEGNVGIPVTYVIKNEKKSELGEFALWGGKTRIFQDDGSGTTIFLGEDNASYTPAGKKMELIIGDSRDIVVTQHKMKDNRINLRRDTNNRVILYDTEEIIQVKIENFRDEPAVLTLIQHIPGQWDMSETTHKYEKEDAGKIKFLVSIPAQGKETVVFNYNRRNVR